MSAHRPIELDDLDYRILDQLQQDSSLTNQALAERVHASPPTCLRRVRHLTECGVIERQVAILNPQHLGIGLTAIIEITLDTQETGALEAFERDIITAPEITQCYRVSSGPDFILIAQIPNMPAYQALAQRVFTRDTHVRNVRSFFATHRSKFDTRSLFSSHDH
ncbi:Lrp/AsnC family transcriptional regulator [Alcaligenaceae bacterium CGII-47]|nr:Lrp/AsnC family transcriptional regulator [Alcaligenaceae bacterium CGII-47]